MTMRSMSIRILLAFAMVIWSPSWCCCAIEAAAANVLEQTTCCHVVASCCSRGAVQSAAKACPLCVEDGIEAGDDGCGDNTPPCRCSDRPSELNRLDTAPKLAAPKLAQVVIADIVWPVDSTLRRPRRSAATRIVQVQRHPPNESLVQQHCLLLI